jgi:hypothetical protein
VDAAPLHPLVEPLAFLLGTWTGEGVGDYPSIERFAYREEVRFAHAGKPFLTYAQRTWERDGGAPLHSESGFWRTVGRGRVELVLAHPFGVVEVSEGAHEDSRLEVTSRTLASSSTGSRVDAIVRRLSVDGDVLRYSVDMAAGGRPLQRHLDAELQRAAPAGAA